MALKRSARHGGNVYAAARELNKPVSAILDFSASINPLGPSRNAIRALKKNVPLIAHYPDPDCTGVRQALASHLRVPQDRIVIGNGSTELIHVIPRALGIRHALIVGPTFSEYACAVRQAGGKCSMLFAARANNYRPPLDELIERFRSGRTRRPSIDAVFLCNPNSPTGRLCEPAELRRVIRAVGRAGSWMILDETFVDYCEEQSMLAMMPAYPRLILLRSFTKFYALPGLRIGYAIGSRAVAANLRRHVPAWTANTMALLAAEAALKDHRHARRSLAYMNRERERFVDKLSRLSGLRLFPSQCNFLLLEFPLVQSKESAVMDCRRKGILVRDCASVPGLTRRTIRIAIRTTRDNDRLVRVLERSCR